MTKKEATIYAYDTRAKIAGNNPFVLDRDPQMLLAKNGMTWSDAQQARSRAWFGPAVEQGTGRRLLFRPANCGSGCYCAAEWKEAA